ncbi:uncharacterized protein LOC115629035 [Scaptodrosophila lebanonensis]|uniref:Uncharacterized protein LOC115629035 n=1 Tax=Drosophila lebanonensis TaxID=7225 RepID=A0A6J2U223_DROLE|nr:uncharacterized protein LOC115629035 [Scaptodrosophila lebanonensis]
MAKSVSKIRGAQMLGISNRWTKFPSQAAYSHVAQLKTKSRDSAISHAMPENNIESLPSSVYNRMSAVSLLCEQIHERKGPPRSMENDHATVQLNRSNSMLTKHHYGALQAQEKLTQRFPDIVHKLMNIMSQGVKEYKGNGSGTPILQHGSRWKKRNSYDYKPQPFNNANKWIIKLPHDPEPADQKCDVNVLPFPNHIYKLPKINTKIGLSPHKSKSEVIEEDTNQSTFKVPLGHYSRPVKPKRKPLELGKAIPICKTNRRKLKMLVPLQVEKLAVMQRDKLERSWNFDGNYIPRLEF